MSMSRVILLIVGLNTVITVGSAVLGYVYFAPQKSLGTAPSEQTQQPVGGRKLTEFAFYPIQKIVVNVPGEKREHYFVLDLALQAERHTDAKIFQNIEPLVRNSVIASLTSLKLIELRQLALDDLQVRIEGQLRQDFASRGIEVPFTHVLVSKILVQ